MKAGKRADPGVDAAAGPASVAAVTDLIERWVRPEVRRLLPYRVADASGLVKLDAMENPYSWPEPIKKEWLAALESVAINRYPDPGAARLKESLARYLGLDAGTGILLGNGSDEIILLLALVLAGPGRTILAPEPTFVMYRLIAEALGSSFVGVPLREPDFALDAPAMERAIAKHAPALVFLACPNNPTGNEFDGPAIEAVLRAAPGLVIVDEAYFPYARHSWLDALGRFPNLLVMQTLSKLGLAGLRVGMLMGDPRWLEEVDKLRLPYNINVLSQATATFIMERADVLEEQAGAIRAERERLRAALAATPGITVWPSEANFLLFRTSRDARGIFESLRARGVLVKLLHGSHALLDGCLRVTVGTPSENDTLLSALASSVNASG